jgi:hypothetical protein
MSWVTWLSYAPHLTFWSPPLAFSKMLTVAILLLEMMKK